VSSSGATPPEDGITRTVLGRVLTSRSRICIPSSFGETGENGEETEGVAGVPATTAPEGSVEGVSDGCFSLMRWSQGPNQYAPMK
jgi:hypothetical protein